MPWRTIIVLVASVAGFLFCMHKIKPLQSYWFRKGIRLEEEIINRQHTEHLDATRQDLDNAGKRVVFWFVLSLICAAIAAWAVQSLF